MEGVSLGRKAEMNVRLRFTVLILLATLFLSRCVNEYRQGKECKKQAAIAVLALCSQRTSQDLGQCTIAAYSDDVHVNCVYINTGKNNPYGF